MVSSSDVTYHDLIARNRRNSLLLVFLFIGLIGTTGGVSSAALVSPTAVAALTAALLSTGIAGLVATWSFYGGGSAILRVSDARPVQPTEDPQLCNIVEEMSIAAGLPSPRVFLIDDTAMNAFATGRDPEHAVVAVTRGLRQRLSRDELQAVIAHEISHIRHFDIRLAMLLATLVGFLLLLTDLFWRLLRHRIWARGARRGREGSAAVTGILLFAAVLFSIVAPILARLIQMAVSRQREFLADAGAVALTRHPEAMISALRKLGEDDEVLEAANRATAHLYFVQPIKKWEQRAQSLFSTHPPLQERIRRLRMLLA